MNRRISRGDEIVAILYKSSFKARYLLHMVTWQAHLAFNGCPTKGGKEDRGQEALKASLTAVRKPT